MVKLNSIKLGVLADLASFERRKQRVHDFPAGWARPLDVGGYDGSHHSYTLTYLVKHGLARRQRASAYGSRGSWLYRITPAGFNTLSGDRP